LEKILLIGLPKNNMFEQLTKAEIALFKKLNTPQKVQDFLDVLPINFEKNGETCFSPRSVIKNKKAHCMEGALFAGAIFMYHQRKPLLLHLKATKHDYDHVIALFQEKSGWGAISKTNHAVLRYRDPVYKSVHELVMSYFHEYFPDNGKKSLYSYSQPLNLRKFNKINWLTRDDDAWRIDWAFDTLPHKIIVPASKMKNMRRASTLEQTAGKLTDWKNR